MNDHLTSGVHSTAKRKHFNLQSSHYTKILNDGSLLRRFIPMPCVFMETNYTTTSLADLKCKCRSIALQIAASLHALICIGNHQQQGSLHFAKRKANQLQVSLSSANHENAISHHANRANRCYFTLNVPLLLGARLGVT